MATPTEHPSPRYVELADVAALHEAVDRVAREERYLAITRAQPVAQIEGWVRDQMAARAPLYVVPKGARVVGWSNVMLGRFSRSHVGYLGMGVVAGHRGQGLGRALLRAAVDHAFLTNGLEKIELEVLADNPVAIGLYLAEGFEREGVRRRTVRLRGEALDLVLMGRFRD